MENATISNSSFSTTVNSALNLVAAFADIIALSICLAFLCVILYRLIRIKYNHGRIKFDVPLILSIDTLCIIIIKSTMQIIHVTVPTLLKDFQIVTEFNKSSFYRVRAYGLWSMIGVLYWSYVLLAFFRFIRVICPAQLWLLRSSFYLYILIPAQFICVFISMSQLIYIFDSLHLLANEAYCTISIKPLYITVYATSITFFLPYTAMCIFYMCIARKMRQSSVIRKYQERNRRDYIVMHRILLNMVILSIVTVPYLVLFIIGVIHDRFDSLIYRVQWLSSSLGSCLFSLALPIITVQLRDLLKQNNLKPINNKT
jgi:hypothetical protein